MNRYGQSLTYGPLSAPQLFTGDAVSFSLRDAETDEDLTDAGDDIVAIAFHSRKGELNFESEITAGSENFLDLSDGAAIAVSALSVGTVLVSETTERWVLGKRKSASVQATWYPDIVSSGGLAAANVNALTPDQSSLGIVLPGGGLIYGTHGLSHAAGVVHELTIRQSLKITEDDPTPDGKIIGAASSSYKRSISLLLLAKGDKPAVRSVLSIPGAPAHAGGYRITSVEERFARMKGKMYALNAVWIPPFGTTGGEPINPGE